MAKSKSGKINKVAFSKMVKSYIKCVGYKSTTDWTFVLCDEHGNVTNGTIQRANTYYSMFKWKECA